MSCYLMISLFCTLRSVVQLLIRMVISRKHFSEIVRKYVVFEVSLSPTLLCSCSKISLLGSLSLPFHDYFVVVALWYGFPVVFPRARLYNSGCNISRQAQKEQFYQANNFYPFFCATCTMKKVFFYCFLSISHQDCVKGRLKA